VKVFWSKRSLADLRHITNRISRDNPTAAARLAKKIFDGAMALESMSFRGRLGGETDTRELVYSGTNYIAVYRVIGEQIRILRIRHAAQDWPRR
jgi:toxin ParE1/3/4